VVVKAKTPFLATGVEIKLVVGIVVTFSLKIETVTAFASCENASNARAPAVTEPR
jgi:hypothetical protein